MVDDFEHAAAGEEFVFDQCDFRFDAGGIAIHQESNRAGGGQHGHLGVAVAVGAAQFESALPFQAGGLFDVGGTGFVLDLVDGGLMLVHDGEHRRFVGAHRRMVHATATAVTIPSERA